MDLGLDQEQVDIIEKVLEEDLMPEGFHSVILIDISGNILASFENGEVVLDLYTLAALAAANFVAVSTMAEIVGEKEFSLLYNKGEKENLHFTTVVKDILLVTVFGHDTDIGSMRVKIDEAADKLKTIIRDSTLA